MLLRVPITEIIQQKVAVVFIENTNFETSSNDAEQKMQTIIDIYNKYYTVIGGYIKHTKIVFYAWRWKQYQDKKKIYPVNYKLRVNNKNMKRLEVH